MNFPLRKLFWFLQCHAGRLHPNPELWQNLRLNRALKSIKQLHLLLLSLFPFFHEVEAHDAGKQVDIHTKGGALWDVPVVLDPHFEPHLVAGAGPTQAPEFLILPQATGRPSIDPPRLPAPSYVVPMTTHHVYSTSQ